MFFEQTVFEDALEDCVALFHTRCGVTFKRDREAMEGLAKQMLACPGCGIVDRLPESLGSRA